MAAADGIKQYWLVLTDKPRLVVFNYLDAQSVWQKHFHDLGGVKFSGKPSYIAFMQAVMMDGVKGTALIGYLGEIYQAAMSPGTSGVSVVKTAVKKAGMGILDYEKQIKDLKNADLGWAWRNSVKYSCGIVLNSMQQALDISPSDIGG